MADKSKDDVLNLLLELSRSGIDQARQAVDIARECLKNQAAYIDTLRTVRPYDHSRIDRLLNQTADLSDQIEKLATNLDRQAAMLQAATMKPARA